MNCIELLAEPSRCKRGVPVARLFRHYFCEGDYMGCPIKGTEKTAKRKLFYSPGGTVKCAHPITR